MASTAFFEAFSARDEIALVWISVLSEVRAISIKELSCYIFHFVENFSK